jgi:hypothetical protein
MDVDELIERAWKAVEKAGVSEAAQPAALQEAVAFLREEHGSGGGRIGGGAAATRRKGSSRGGPGARPQRPPDPPVEDLPDEDTFFATLASESGVEENELRDVLRYTGGKVTVSPPTRMFGDSKTAQAKAITALVAGARAKGLGESSVPAGLVHDELKRKQCWDQNNFNKHLGALQGFNVGSDRSEIVTTSKWVGEFSEAVARALGKTENE